jgi:multiple sugar transport system permease protein
MSRRPPKRRGRDTGPALAMSLPAVLGLTLFVALPFSLAAVVSFTNLRLGSPLPWKFVGFQQYERIFTDSSFQRALLNNGLFALVVVPLQTALALGLALLLNRPRAGQRLFRTVFFLPVVFPMALLSVVWNLIYAPGPQGLANAVLHAASFGRLGPVDFLHDPVLALPSIMVMSIWQGIGFQMVVLLAGLQAIPPALHEAAALDGAGRFRRLVHVTLPGLRNPLIFTVLVTTILAFRVFDQVQIMTRGGPIDATTTVMYEAVQASFQRQQVAQASAMTVVFFVVVLVLTGIQRALVRQESEVA